MTSKYILSVVTIGRIVLCYILCTYNAHNGQDFAAVFTVCASL